MSEMDAQPSSWLPPSFQEMCQRVVECLKEPGLGVVGVSGWDGVGRRRVVRHVVEMLVGGGGGDGDGDSVGTTTMSNVNSDPPFFRYVLRLSKLPTQGEGVYEVARRIQEMLQSERNEAGEPFGDWWEPLTFPERAMLVVIEEDMSYGINLNHAFGSIHPSWSNWQVKIVSSRTPPNWLSSAAATDHKYQQYWIFDDFNSLPDEEAWCLLRHEAGEMAEELCRRGDFGDGEQRRQLPFTVDAIMECFLYTTLHEYKSWPSPFPPYWWCEGLVRPSAMAASAATSSTSTATPIRITKEYFDMFHLLSTKFTERITSSPWGDTRDRLERKVRTIATTLYQSPPSRIKKKGRFMVGEYLEELPQDMERWDQQGITRVSLRGDQIKRLQWYHGPMSNISPPKCKNLSTLILSYNSLLEGIQDDFFEGMIMPNLRVLDLSFTEGLQVLPTSLTCLTNLRFLNLQGCTSLQTISPCLDRGFLNLEILDIRDCPLPEMATASFRQVPNLLLLNTTVSLQGCSWSYALSNIEVLDLSGTKVERLPYLSEMTRLNRLDLLNTRHLSEVSWSELRHVPATINWDQCGCCTITPHSIGTGHLRMCVQDVQIFKSLGKDHQLWSQQFQEFYIHVHPCVKESKQHPHSVSRPAPDHHSHHHLYRHPHKESPSSPYKNLNLPKRKQGQSDHQSNNYDPPADWRYLQICGVSTPFTTPMEGVLPNMHSLQLCNHDTIRLLLVTHPMELRTCQVVKCPSMETLFYGRPTTQLAHLESINLFHLIRLETLYKGNFGSAGSFACLRSVYVHNCPRMITVFSSTPRSILLPRLEELVISSCGTLSEVFGRGAVGSTVAPALSYLCLWDLPELKNVCDGCLPSLRTIQLRGCAKLRALPLPLVDSEGKPFKMDIIAEHKWWENLNEANKKHIIFKPWSPWTSRS